MTSHFHNGVKNFVNFSALCLAISSFYLSFFRFLSYYLLEYQKRIERFFFVQTRQLFKVTYIFSIFFFKFSHFVMTLVIEYDFYTSIMGGYLLPEAQKSRKARV